MLWRRVDSACERGRREGAMQCRCPRWEHFGLFHVGARTSLSRLGRPLLHGHAPHRRENAHDLV
jgi:hypothetical protein